MLKYTIFTILFVKIVSTSCDKQYGSLTFVIDDTASMRTEIDLVKHAANRTIDIVLKNNASQIKDIVIVTFNDPESKTTVRLPQSRDRRTVENALDDILSKVHGGGDCPEYSLSGISKGLTESMRNSYLFVFTDATPKDGHVFYKSSWNQWQLDQKKLSQKIADVKKLAQSRGSQVFFFLTKSADCHEAESLYQPYWDIAAGTNGQVFRLTKKEDVADLLPFLEIVISGEGDIIKRVEVQAKERAIIPFTIDDQTEYVVISASSSDGDVDLAIRKGPTQEYQRISWNKNNKIIKINSPDPGSYEASVLGSSNTTVMVFGRTDFTFQHGFSETVPPTFRGDKQQPTDGIKSFLLIKVNDPTQSVNIETVQITSSDGKTVYHSLPLKKKIDNYYTTDLFLAPNSMFLITVIGKGKKTLKDIKRTAKTPIEPRPRDTDPEITIQGGGTYTYNSKVELTCNIKAYPKPVITWRDGKGNILPTSSLIPTNANHNKYQHISKMSIQNLKHKEAYYCSAQVGANENSERVDLDVTSPFIVYEDNSKASITTVEFGDSAVLQCNIKSKIPIQIVWYHVSGSSTKKLESSAEYMISSDGTQMTVNKVKQENEGKYYCVAYIPGDIDTKYQLERDIKLKHVAPVMGTSETIRVKEGDSVNINCNILKAYPAPIVRWMYKEPNNGIFRPLNKEGKILRIDNTNSATAGVYKCIATNDKGSRTLESTVIVLSKPKMKLLANNEEKATVNIEYNDKLELACHVLSHSSPDIVWKNEKKEVIKPDNTVSKYNEYKSFLTISRMKRSDIYYCEATNELGTKTLSVSALVNTPFHVDSTNKIVDVEYGEEASVKCGITSRFPIKIVWLKDTKEIAEGSDKYSVSEDGTVLKIKNVNLDSRGKYICKASVVGDEPSAVTHATNVDITVEKPYIDRQPNVKITRNQTAVLKCHVLKGIPKPAITWLVKKDNMAEFSALSESGEKLTIPFAQYDDTGLYKCVAQNVIGAATLTVKLTVEGPPQILSDEDKLYTAVVGDVTLRIPCVAVGYPKPIITWKTGSAYSGRKFNIDDDGTLVIKNPQVDNSNKHTCTATNKYGSAEKTFEAFVTDYIDEDQAVGNITYVDLLVGETKQLDCSSGSLKGRWYKEWYLMNLTGALTINDAKRSKDEGNFTCRISDSMGSKSHTYIVEVGSAPEFEIPNDEKINWDGKNKMLSCAVSIMRPSKRTAKAEWFYNGKASTSAVGDLQQSQHPIKSWGHYTCNISNVHGYVTKNIYVHSSGCLMNLDSTVTKSPLIMNAAGAWPLLTLTEQYIFMQPKQALLLFCNSQTKPGSFHNIPNKTEVIATCDHEDQFLVDGNKYKLSDLQCDSEVTPVVQETGEKCSFENTEIIKVGYNVQQPEPHFLEVYTVCFDKNQKLPLYTKLKVTQVNHVRVKNVSWQKYDKYYNEKSGEFCGNDSNCCLEKHQLVNQLDVTHGPPQLATFIEGLNSVSYWRGCETIADTWDEIDSKIRSRMRKPYSVLSGVHNYSDKNGIMVPRYLWKMVRQSKNAIVIVKVNDPLPTSKDILCNTGCPSWIVPLMKDRFTYCCKPDDFQRKFMPVLDN